jgi:hypothetical protein
MSIEFRSPHVTWSVRGHTRVIVKDIAPLVAEDKEDDTEKSKLIETGVS